MSIQQTKSHYILMWDNPQKDRTSYSPTWDLCFYIYYWLIIDWLIDDLKRSNQLRIILFFFFFERKVRKNNTNLGQSLTLGLFRFYPQPTKPVYIDLNCTHLSFIKGVWRGGRRQFASTNDSWCGKRLWVLHSDV